MNIVNINNDKFKTNILSIFLSTKLDRENVAKNALLPAILRRGSKDYPTMRDISKRLEELYGARFDCGVSKKGELQVIRFYIETINDKLLDSKENLLEEAKKLLNSIIFNPLIENGRFNDDYIEQEKRKVKDIIASKKNDKVQYALEHCYEIMCEGEPFELSEFGTPEMIDAVTNEELVETYYNMINNYDVEIFISGNDISNELGEGFAFGSKEKNIIEENVINVYEQKNVTEDMDVNQGKLSLGYRTNIFPKSEDYYSLLVMNGILGGGVHSKLFQNVREKNSLAYYVFSRMDKFKGIMGISCGIESENHDKALETILEQVSDIKEGKVTKEEFDTTIKTIENSLKSMQDEQVQVLDFYYGQSLIGDDTTIEEVIEKIKKVTVEDVIEVSKKLQLDTVYFLKPRV